MSELVDALWDQQPPSTARNVIQTYLKHLRRVLEPERPPRAPSQLVRRESGGYRLELSSIDLDLLRFRGLVGMAVDLARAGDQQRAAEKFGQAVYLWQGSPLANAASLGGHPRVVALSRERWGAVALFGEAMLATGKAADALSALEEAAASCPLDEAAQARLIRAYHRIGQRGQAFATYRVAHRRLADELGIDPGPELAAAYQAMLAEDRALQVEYAELAANTPVPDLVSAQPVIQRGEWEVASGAVAPGHTTPIRPVPAQLPADVSTFIGRRDEIAWLDALLVTDGGEVDGQDSAPTAVVISALSGTAGVGKTVLAIHWAHRVRDRFPDGQLYVNLHGYDPNQPLTAAEAVARFLRSLGVAERDIPVELDERTARYRTEVAGRRLLVVLDNASSVDQVRPLLPGTATSMVIITSRDSLAGLVAVDGARRINLDLLPLTDAHTLLRRLIGPRADDEPHAVTTLATLCGRLPIALRVAAELASSRSNTTLTEYVEELADEQRRLDVLSPAGDPRAAVAAVFSWSIQHLPAEAAQTFPFLGLHPAPELAVHAVAALVDTSVTQARRNLDILARAHLVHRIAADRYGMHDLLRAYAARLTAGEGCHTERQAALGRLFDYYLATAAAAMDRLYPAEMAHRPRISRPATPIPDHADPDAARRWLDTERHCLLAVAAYAAGNGWPTCTTRLSAILFRYLDGGHHTDAVTLHDHACDAAERSGDQSEQAQALFRLGVAHEQMAHHVKAIVYLERALALFEQAGEHRGEARALLMLGVADWRLGSHESAAVRLERARALFRQAGDPAGEANTRTNLGIVERRQGRHRAAADHHRYALALFRRIGDRNGEARALDHLGLTERLLGKNASAQDHHEQALALFRQLGNRHGEAHALDNLGNLHTRLGRPEQAAEHLQHALALFRDIGDRDGEAWALNSLGEAAYATEDVVEAVTHHTAALAIATDIADPDQQARAHTGLGHTQHNLSNRRRARHHYQRALALYAENSPEADALRAHLAGLADARGEQERGSS
jgi:tetratricopeptide (TPR) repeat protein